MELNVELHEFSAAGVPSRLKIASAYDTEAMRRYHGEILGDPSATCLVAVVTTGSWGTRRYGSWSRRPTPALSPRAEGICRV